MAEEKDFFAKLAGVGPDGKFSNYSQKKAQSQVSERANFDRQKNGQSQSFKKAGNDKEYDIDAESEAQENVSDEQEGQLAVDVYSTPMNFVVEAAVAGVKGEDIDIAITLDSITIKGRRSKEELSEEKDYLYQECFWGRFSRSITFNQEIDADRAQASFKNGILRVILPKIQRDKPKKLKVRFE